MTYEFCLLDVDLLGIEGFGKGLFDYLCTCGNIRGGLLFKGRYCSCYSLSYLFMQVLIDMPFDFYVIFV